MLLWSRKPRTRHKRQCIQILVHYQLQWRYSKAKLVTILQNQVLNAVKRLFINDNSLGCRRHARVCFVWRDPQQPICSVLILCFKINKWVLCLLTVFFLVRLFFSVLFNGPFAEAFILSSFGKIECTSCSSWEPGICIHYLISTLHQFGNRWKIL